MELYAQITKVDEARREVWGRAAQEVPDRAGEIMDYASSKPFFAQWSEQATKSTGGKSMGNVRSMHGSVAAGKVIALAFDDAQKAVDVGVKVVDDNEWEKVLEGVHSGFSIGGRYEKKWQDGDYVRYTAAPSEISLVDRPCIPTALFFNIQKTDGSTVRQFFKSQPEAITMGHAIENRAVETRAAENAADNLARGAVNQPGAVDRLAELLNKGVVTPERLVELAGREPRRNPHLAKLHKGLDGVANLASLLDSLSWLQQSCQWEAEIEGDGSKIPASILAAVRQLADALIAMADEETQEMLAALLPDDATLAQGAKRGKLSKMAGAELAHVQTAHDHLVSCGAVCHAGLDTAADPPYMPDDSGNSGVNAPVLTQVKAALDELGKRLNKIEQQPLPAKGVLRAIAKEEDVELALEKHDIAGTPGQHNPEAAQALIKRQFEQRGLR